MGKSALNRKVVAVRGGHSISHWFLHDPHPRGMVRRMSALEHLREAIERKQHRMLSGMPADREPAILAILRIQDQRQSSPGNDLETDLVTGRRIANLGANKALQLCFESAHGQNLSRNDLVGWADRFLRDCDQLASAEMVLNHCETGFMRLVEHVGGSFEAWIATKRQPTSWRERADIDWWASSLTRQIESDGRSQTSLLDGMAYQLGYASDDVIGGCSVQTYRDILGWLIDRTLEDTYQGSAAKPITEQSLINRIAADLGIEPAIAVQAVSSLTVDQDSSAYHAAIPGVAAAPLVRIAPDRIAISLYGLTTEPWFFLTREIRRRDAEEYHNSAYLREIVFRKDLYALFQDKRFITSTGRIQLRREGGEVRTDIDAAVFDRKTGTLGIFELKSQDPFARSAAELTRQRDNFLFANRQISGALDWIKRHGADEILARIDSRVAKTFRAHKVYPFVLGRYLAHFNDGAEPDKRAAWATWPQVLRLLEEQPQRGTDANPIASLFTRLSKDAPRSREMSDEAPKEINIGNSRLVVYPSYAAYQASFTSTLE